MIQAYENNNAKMITGPVAFNKKTGLFSMFLELDFMSLIGITCGSIKQHKPIMTNGANLLYEKNIFNEIKGFDGNEHIASGDDVFLMQKIDAEYPNSIHFLKNKDAITYTDAPNNFKDFINQRIRWTSKSVGNASISVTWTLFFNYFFNLFIFINLFALAFSNIIFFWLGVLMLITKITVDYFFFTYLLSFFNRKQLLKHLFPLELLHLIYINLLGLLSLYGKYSWKGRKN